MQGSKRSNEVAVPVQGASGAAEGQPNAVNQAVGTQVPAPDSIQETRHGFSHAQVEAPQASCLNKVCKAVLNELRAKNYWAWGTMALSTAGNCLLLYDASSTSIVGVSLAGVGGLASVFLKGLSLDFELDQQAQIFDKIQVLSRLPDSRLEIIEKPINKFAVGSALMIPTILQCALEIISACLRLISHLDISKDEFKGPSAYLVINIVGLVLYMFVEAITAKYGKPATEKIQNRYEELKNEYLEGLVMNTPAKLKERLEQIIEWGLKHQGPFIRLVPDLTDGIVRAGRAGSVASEAAGLTLQ